MKACLTFLLSELNHHDELGRVDDVSSPDSMTKMIKSATLNRVQGHFLESYQLRGKPARTLVFFPHLRVEMRGRSLICHNFFSLVTFLHTFSFRLFFDRPRKKVIWGDYGILRRKSIHQACALLFSSLEGKKTHGNWNMDRERIGLVSC